MRVWSVEELLNFQEGLTRIYWKYGFDQQKKLNGIGVVLEKEDNFYLLNEQEYYLQRKNYLNQIRPKASDRELTEDELRAIKKLGSSSYYEGVVLDQLEYLSSDRYVEEKAKEEKAEAERVAYLHSLTPPLRGTSISDKERSIFKWILAGVLIFLIIVFTLIINA